MILGGTPFGTFFNGVGIWRRLEGLGGWLMDGFAQPLPTYPISAYIDYYHRHGGYLAAGDLVTVHIDSLGIISNRIVP
jgi:hypothetical protein